MNKNNVIFILFVAALFGSTWGAIVNSQKIDLKQQLSEARAELSKISAVSTQERVQVLGKTAGIQDSLAEKENQLAKARKELVSLRRDTQALEAKLSGCNAALQELSRTTAGQEPLIEADAVQVGTDLGDKASGEPRLEGKPGPTKLQVAWMAAKRLQKRLDEAKAQLLGLEKIVEEKNTAIQEAAQEKERLKINMDVLLAKISDQKRELREVQDENGELVKLLAARKQEIAELRQERQPGRN